MFVSLKMIGEQTRAAAKCHGKNSLDWID